MGEDVTELPPPTILEIFGPPALLSSEDSGRYQKMLALVARDSRPTDIVGWSLIKRLIDEFFEIARYRRFKAMWIQVHSEKITGAKVRAIESEENHKLGHLLRTFSLGMEIEKFDENRRRGWGGAYIEEFEAKRRELAAIEAEEEQRRLEHAARVAHARSARPNEPELVAILPSLIQDYELLDRMLRAAERRFNATRTAIDRHCRGLGTKLHEGFEEIIEAEVIHERVTQPASRAVRRISSRSRKREPASRRSSGRVGRLLAKTYQNRGGGGPAGQKVGRKDK